MLFLFSFLASGRPFNQIPFPRYLGQESLWIFLQQISKMNPELQRLKFTRNKPFYF